MPATNSRCRIIHRQGDPRALEIAQQWRRILAKIHDEGFGHSSSTCVHDSGLVQDGASVARNRCAGSRCLVHGDAPNQRPAASHSRAWNSRNPQPRACGRRSQLNEAVRRTMPRSDVATHQRLESGDSAGRGLDQGLVVQDQLVALDCAVQLPRSRSRARAHGWSGCARSVVGIPAGLAGLVKGCIVVLQTSETSVPLSPDTGNADVGARSKSSEPSRRRVS